MEKKFAYKTEIHAHTKPVSACSFITPEMLVDSYVSVGAHGVTVTNHLNPKWIGGDLSCLAEKYTADYYAAKEAAEGKDLDIIFGVEIRFPENDNDYLIYGIAPEDTEEIISLIGEGIEGFYKKFKNKKNLILQAHPFRNGMMRAPLDSIDGIEVFNMHPHHNSRVGLAARYARDNDLIISGGSDYHDEGWHALCLLRTKDRLRDSYDVAEALRERDVAFDISGNIILPYMA